MGDANFGFLNQTFFTGVAAAKSEPFRICNQLLDVLGVPEINRNRLFLICMSHDIFVTHQELTKRSIPKIYLNPTEDFPFLLFDGDEQNFFDD